MVRKQDTEPFRLAVGREFAFLASEFGFTEERVPKDNLDYVAVVAPTAKFDPESMPTGAFEQLRLLAEMLRGHGSSLLQGDCGVFPAIQTRIDQRRADWESRQ